MEMRIMSHPDRERWQRLAPLLDELLDLEAPARAARLAQWHASDPATADELAALLDAAAAADAAGFLGGQAGDAVPEAATLAGMRIGPYVVDGPLGQGGS